MFKSPTFLIAAFLFSLFGFMPKADAATIGFDDVAVNNNGWGYIQDYQGFTWQGGVVLDAKNHALTNGQKNGLISANNIFLASSLSHISSFSSENTFNFESGYFTKSTAGGELITLSGWLGDNQKYTKSFSVSNLTPAHILFDWSNINKVLIQIVSTAPLVIDNLVVSSAVPLPAALPLFGCALTALMVARRKRKNLV